MVDQQRIESAVAAILEALGEDPAREGLRNTPQRVARMYEEMFSGIGADPRAALDAVFEEDGHHEEVVIVRDVSFFSICEHHMLPFFGKAHMGYIPDGRIAGVSKLGRALEVVARQPQLQERMTGQLADAMCDVLRPEGAAVVIEAEHMCMSMRGIKKPGSLVVTSAVRGTFEKIGVRPAEFLAMLQGRLR